MVTLICISLFEAEKNWEKSVVYLLRWIVCKIADKILASIHNTKSYKLYCCKTHFNLNAQWKIQPDLLVPHFWAIKVIKFIPFHNTKCSKCHYVLVKKNLTITYNMLLKCTDWNSIRLLLNSSLKLQEKKISDYFCLKEIYKCKQSL